MAYLSITKDFFICLRMLLKRTSQLITIIFFGVHCILLPRIWEGPVHLKELHPQFLPLPKYVMQISPGPNYDYHSPVMRFTISSPLIPDAVVDYDLSNGNWNIIEQQNIFRERTRILLEQLP